MEKIWKRYGRFILVICFSEVSECLVCLCWSLEWAIMGPHPLSVAMTMIMATSKRKIAVVANPEG